MWPLGGALLELDVCAMQYLYNRPILTLVDMMEGILPFANLIPAATLGWAIEQGYIGKDFFKVDDSGNFFPSSLFA